MIRVLDWVGLRARWVLIIGCMTALLYPVAAAALRPALPVLVAMVVMVSMLRIDLAALARRIARPRRIVGMLALSAFLLVGPTVLVWGALTALGLGADYGRMAVYSLAAPPIASAATLCLLMGLNAALALEITIVMSLIMPVLGPAVVFALIGASIDISPLEMGLRMAAMICGGAAAAVILRRLIGPERLERRAQALDGIGVLAMVLFVIPLFDGVSAMIVAEPGLAASMLALACLLIWGPAALGLLAPRPAPVDAGALGVIGGTRSIALYLAAAPPDPVFTLYAALYQFPMLGLPLVFQGVWRRRLRKKG